MADAPARPRRRWRVHAQLPDKALTIHSFQLLDNAERVAQAIRSDGGQAMVEDRWIGRGESSKGVIPWKEQP